MNVRSLPRAYGDAPPKRPDLSEALRAARESVAAEDRAAEAVEAEARRAEEEQQIGRHEAELEAARAAEAAASLRDADADRMAYAIAIVQCTEAQKGRYIPSRKGAQTVVLIKRLLDALHDDDAPVVYPQFETGALGGRSKLDMAAIEKAITGETDLPPAGEGGAPEGVERRPSSTGYGATDEGLSDSAPSDETDAAPAAEPAP